MQLLAVILALSILLILYTYAGYPLLLLLFTRFRKPRPCAEKFPQPKITLIVAAYNEEKNIEQKIINCKELDYPADLLEIIFVSDGSTDNTNELLKKAEGGDTRCLILPARSGKTTAQNAAVSIATGHILVFSDAATRIEPGAIARMIDYFRDESVGLVSGEDRYYNPAGHGTNEGQGFYIRYEMALRRLESKFGSTVSASGCFYAVRANLRGELTAEQIDDLAVPMKVIRAGKRIISAGDAVAWYPGVDSPEKEFQRRIRMVVGGIRSMFANLDVIEPIHHARFSFQFISHKLLRWLVPFFMLIAFLSSAILAASHTLFLLIFGSQIAFYFLALLGHRIRHSRKLPKAISIPYFFCGSNYCVLLAWIKLFQGARFVTWEPSRS